jgi:hypothetical protein
MLAWMKKNGTIHRIAFLACQVLATMPRNLAQRDAIGTSNKKRYRSDGHIRSVERASLSLDS